MQRGLFTKFSLQLREDKIFFGFRPDHLFVELPSEPFREIGRPGLVRSHSRVMTPQAVESNVDSHNVVRGCELVIVLITDPCEPFVGAYPSEPGGAMGLNRNGTKLVFE